jgi:hypothetical protein
MEKDPNKLSPKSLLKTVHRASDLQKPEEENQASPANLSDKVELKEKQDKPQQVTQAGSIPKVFLDKETEEEEEQGLRPDERVD